MSWRIDRDYIDANRVGVRQGEPEGETFRFRILDDDGEVYYGGVYDAAAAAADEAEGGLYQALQFGTWDAGATDLQVRVADGIRHGLTSRKHVDGLGLADDAWISIYG